MAKHHIEIDASPFIQSHMRKPSGRGSWAFSFERNPGVDNMLWTPSMTYSAACAYVKRFMQAAQTEEDLRETARYMHLRNLTYVESLPLHLRPGKGGAWITLFVQS